jgi:hypothetical protein
MMGLEHSDVEPLLYKVIDLHYKLGKELPPQWPS